MNESNLKLSFSNLEPSRRISLSINPSTTIHESSNWINLALDMISDWRQNNPGTINQSTSSTTGNWHSLCDATLVLFVVPQDGTAMKRIILIWSNVARYFDGNNRITWPGILIEVRLWKWRYLNASFWIVLTLLWILTAFTSQLGFSKSQPNFSPTGEKLVWFEYTLCLTLKWCFYWLRTKLFYCLFCTTR